MSDRPHAPEFPLMTPESPGLPERTGSHPRTFVPAPFTRRPIPPYPQRADHATFDPAFHRASPAADSAPQHPSHANASLNIPAPIERRAGSEPHNGWRRQNDEVDTRRISIPPALEISSLTFRDRLPYPDRSMDELTIWMPPPIVTPRRYGSQPVTVAERLAVRPSERPNDWAYGWPEENNPYRTIWTGFDNSRYAITGGIDDPNETAAVPNEQVLESIEIEGDPLIALRRAAHDSQIIRGELEVRVALEDQNRALRRNNRILEASVGNLTRSEVEARDALSLAEQERDIRQRERDLARRRVEQLRLELDEPEEASLRRQAQREAYAEAMERETSLRDTIRNFELSEAELMAELDSATTRANQLQAELVRSENDVEQFEMERDHYWTERDRERDRNQNLQAQVQDLQDRLRGAQALALPPLVIAPPVNATPVVLAAVTQPAVSQPPVNPPPIIPPPVIPPPVIPPPLAPHGAGSVRIGGRGRGTRDATRRGGREGRNLAAATRTQPKRNCKVDKSYRN